MARRYSGSTLRNLAALRHLPLPCETGPFNTAAMTCSHDLPAARIAIVNGCKTQLIPTALAGRRMIITHRNGRCKIKKDEFRRPNILHTQPPQSRGLSDDESVEANIFPTGGQCPRRPHS